MSLYNFMCLPAYTQSSPVKHTLKAEPSTDSVHWCQICRPYLEFGERLSLCKVKKMEMKTLDRKTGEGGIKEREY